MARKYRKKPVVVEAVQFLDTAERVCEISEFMDGVTVDYGKPGKPVVKIKTLEGVMRADVGDWIIKGISGMGICRCRRCGNSIGVVFRGEEVITFVICDKCGHENIFVHDERNKKRLDELFGKEED